MPTLHKILFQFLLLPLIVLQTTKNCSAQDYTVRVVPFNSEKYDFAPTLYKDGVVFCSSRVRKKLSFDEDTVRSYTDMYYTRYLGSKGWTPPEVFSPELTGYLNEGPATFNDNEEVIYYGANVNSTTNKKEKIQEYKLGILTAHKINGTWVKGEPFKYNAAKYDYDVVQPFLAPGDSILFFASNMPGGIGGMDIYKCILSNGQWGVPINLGRTVNSINDELFPYISNDGGLYISSNHGEENIPGDWNIFVTYPEGDEYSELTELPYPANTGFDDYAYVEFQNENNGFVSSNRNDHIDRIYSFERNIGGFSECPPNDRSVFCYEIEDTRIAPSDSLPVVFEWDLGDGTKKRGYKIEHCYTEYGHYSVQLNLIDTISNALFFAVSQTELDIVEHRQPFIISNDTTLVNSPLALFADLTALKDEKLDNIYWQIDGGQMIESDSLKHAFQNAGYHEVTLGIMTKRINGSRPERYCTTKQIYVSSDYIEGFPQADPSPFAEPIKKINLKYDYFAETTEKRDTIMSTYQILIAESVVPIPSDSPLFSKTNLVITEYKTDDGKYQYTVGSTNDVLELYSLFNELKAIGYDQPVVRALDKKTVSTDAIRTICKSALPEARLMPSYHVLLKKTREPVSFFSPFFDGTDLDITEYKNQKEQYEYTVGNSDNEADLEPILIQLRENGYSDVTITAHDPNISTWELIRTNASDKTTAIVIKHSDVPMAAHDPYFAAAKSKITENRNAQGQYLYTVDTPAGANERNELLNELHRKGYSEAQIVSGISMSHAGISSDKNLKADYDKILTDSSYRQTMQHAEMPIALDSSSFIKSNMLISEHRNKEGKYEYSEQIASIHSQVVAENGQNKFSENSANPQAFERKSEVLASNGNEASETISPGETKENIMQSGNAMDVGLSTSPDNKNGPDDMINKDKTEDKNSTSLNPTTESIADAQTNNEDYTDPEISLDVMVSGNIPYPGGNTIQDSLITKNLIDDEDSTSVHTATDSAAAAEMNNMDHAHSDIASDITGSSNITNQNINTVQDSVATKILTEDKNSASINPKTKRVVGVQTNVEGTVDQEINSDIAPSETQALAYNNVAPPVAGKAVDKISGTNNPAGDIVSDYTNDTDDSLKMIYRVLLTKRTQRIPFNHSFFSKNEYVIMEFLNESGEYEYTVGNTDRKENLNPIIEELQSKGYTNLKVLSVDKKDLSENFIRTGSYFEPGNATRLNIEFFQLSDIRFEYNSDKILDVSKPNLDYVSAMLQIEEDFELNINAHTDTIGTYNYNMNLSLKRAKSVMDYLGSKGVEISRIHPKGFAATKPKADNLTEDGRAQNRRVELIIVFSTTSEVSLAE